MSKLRYKDILFDSFSFSDDDCKIYIDESNAKTLEGFEGGGWGYICPHCIKKYGFYEETGLTEEQLGQIIHAEHNDVIDDFICCVDGCYNKNAFDINFRTEDCELIREEK